MEKRTNKIDRIIDANFNRAREGLRVIEDVSRFILDNQNISKSAKDMRSAISIIQKNHSTTISQRDTKKDVGRVVDSKKEFERDSLEDIIEANAKRTQEALRVLEEMYKLIDINLAKEIKQLRYQSYTLEKMLIDEFKGMDI